MKNIFRVVKLARPYHPQLIALAILILITAALQLASPVVVKFIVDEIERQIRTGTGDMQRLTFFIGIVFAVAVVGTILDSVNQRIGDYINGRIGRFLTETFYRKIFTLPQKYFDSELSGKIVNQLSRGIVSLQDFLSATTNFIMPAFLQSIFIIGVLFYYHPVTALLALSIYPIYIGISHYSTKKWGEKEVEKNRIEDISRGRIQEVIANIKLVRSFNRQEDEQHFISKKLTRSVSIYDKQSLMYHLLNFARNFGLEIVLIIISVIVFREAFQGTISLGVMVLIIQLLGQLRRPLFAMSFILERIQRAEAGSKEYFTILNLPSVEDIEDRHAEYVRSRSALKLVSASHANKQKKTLQQVQGDLIEFRDVSFSYEDGSPVLKNVSFTLKSPQIVALVGHSGAGKTTLTNMILKFYEPDKGLILLNGKKYADLSHQDVRSHMSLVFQDAELFSTTVGENVSYGNPHATEKEILDALKQANAYDFVMKFPKKLETEIGERGIKLSGGQKQRIQIARAILHNTPILLLDEATSSLDARSEHMVQDALDRLMKDKLVIIIAHRFSTIQNADRVLVIDNGKIVNDGPPQDLARKKGIFSDLLRYQVEGNQKLLETYELAG